MTSPIYKSLKSSHARRFPVLVRFKAVGEDLPVERGPCQMGQCEIAAVYARVWLDPVDRRKLRVAHLNGVRYCPQHAYELSMTTGIPLLDGRGQLLIYHSKVIEAANAGSNSAEVALMDPDATLVGTYGAARRQLDGAILVTMESGEERTACCFNQALVWISARPRSRLPSKLPSVHSDGCTNAAPIAT